MGGNRRLVYQALRNMGGGRVSCGTLANLSGCHKQTVLRVVHELAARGLIRIYSERGRPSVYELNQ